LITIIQAKKAASCDQPKDFIIRKPIILLQFKSVEKKPETNVNFSQNWADETLCLFWIDLKKGKKQNECFYSLSK
jgi:hypothetical protein